MCRCIASLDLCTPGASDSPLTLVVLKNEAELLEAAWLSQLNTKCISSVTSKKQCGVESKMLDTEAVCLRAVCCPKAARTWWGPHQTAASASSIYTILDVVTTYA